MNECWRRHVTHFIDCAPTVFLNVIIEGEEQKVTYLEVSPDTLCALSKSTRNAFNPIGIPVNSNKCIILCKNALAPWLLLAFNMPLEKCNYVSTFITPDFGKLATWPLLPGSHCMCLLHIGIQDARQASCILENMLQLAYHLSIFHLHNCLNTAHYIFCKNRLVV